MDGLVPPSGFAYEAGGAVSGRGQHTPWGGRADGGHLGPAGRLELAGRPRFDIPVAERGYAWWYLDALSTDRRCGLTIIGFVGSVFSPYYASARRAGCADPLNHCSLNVCLYMPWRKLWAMTERTSVSVRRSADTFEIGGSRMEWRGDSLVIHIDERANPLPFPIRGTVRLHPGAIGAGSFVLDAKERHRWWPVAPFAHVEAAFEAPSLRWSGDGYSDMNSGEEPLEDGFRHWNWARAGLNRGAAILYDVTTATNGKLSLALRIGADGAVQPVPPPPVRRMRPSIWLMPRDTRADAGPRPRIRRTLEDTPFYARTMVDTKLFGEKVTAVHESLSLTRFKAAWVQKLLPYRIPRRDEPPGTG